MMMSVSRPFWIKEYGIRGEQLMLALEIIRYCNAAKFYREEMAKQRGWSEQKVKEQLQRINARLLLRCPETIWEGDHRGGPSIGLRPLYHVLVHTENLGGVMFNVLSILRVFLDAWSSIVPTIAPVEMSEFWNFFDAIRTKQLVENDLRE